MSSSSGLPLTGARRIVRARASGPQALRTTDYLPLNGSRPHLAFDVDPLRDQRVVDIGDVPMLPGEIEQSLHRLEQAVTEIAQLGALPVILGGDHSISLADVKGVARHYAEGRFSLVHFDAHSDTAVWALRISPRTWDLGTASARDRLHPGDNIVQIGDRNGGSPTGRAWRRQQGIHGYEVLDVDQRGLDTCLEEAIVILSQQSDAVFLSIDLDAVDPAFAPGVGTPEPGGLTSRQLLHAVGRLASELPLAGIDVAELSPPYDGPGQITAYLANRIVLEALAAFCRRGQRAEDS